MNLYGLIGYPLSHSFSKKYFTEKFKTEKIVNAKYELFELKTIEELPKLIKQKPNLKGFNVTIPYKEEIISYLDEIDKDARLVGAVNTVKICSTHGKTKLIGYNTDIYGFEKSLIKIIKTKHKNALILGTGGAAKAVAFVFNKLNIDYYFVSRYKSKSNKIITYPKITSEIISKHLLIVNTTPVGTYPNISEFPQIPYKYLTKNHILYDLIYNPPKTTFLNKGTKFNATIKNGLEMLHLQAEKSWEIYKQ